MSDLNNITNDSFLQAISCTKCNEVKPLSEFNKQKSSKTGLTPHCKLCNRERAAEWRLNNLERARAKVRANQVRYKAERIRLRLHDEHVLVRNRVLAKIRKVATHKVWMGNNVGSQLVKRKHYYDNNRTKILAANKKWREDNRERRLAYLTRHRLDNLATYSAAEAKRRADIDLRTPPWFESELVKAKYIAAANMSDLVGLEVQVDHIIPLRGKLVSGLHCIDNLQLMDATSNQVKTNTFEVA